jgi:hypothetical protein
MYVTHLRVVGERLFASEKQERIRENKKKKID